MRRTVARLVVGGLVVSAASVTMALAHSGASGNTTALTASSSAAAKAKAAANADQAAKSAKAKSSTKSGKPHKSKRQTTRALARQLDQLRRVAEKPPVLTADGRIVPAGSKAKARPTGWIIPKGDRRVQPKATRSTVKQRKNPPKGFRKSAAYRMTKVADRDPSSTSGGMLRLFTASAVNSGSISGTLSDAVTGLPVAGACVESYRYESTINDYQSGPVACADSAGDYVLSGLQAGSYYLRVTDHVTGHLDAWTDGDLHLLDNQAMTGINFALEQGGMLAGTVTDTGGHPLEGVCTSAISLDQNDEYNGGCTDASGHYQSAGIPAGTWKVVIDDRDGQHLKQWFNGAADFAAATEVQIAVAQITSGIDASMTLGGSISGTVTGVGGAALEDICVSFDSEALGVEEVSCTDASGNYRSPGLPTGSYVVAFNDYSGTYRGEYYNDSTTIEGATTVSVTLGQETPNIDANLTRYGQIHGTVTTAATGAPISGVCVAAVDPSTGYPVSETETDLDGTYTLTGLADGSYQVEFACDYGQWIEQWYDGASTRAAATEVAASLGAITNGVDAALDPYGSISGTVTGADTGSGAADICVQATSTTAPDSDHRTGYANTGADGHYQILGLAAGSYHVQFQDCSNNPKYVARYYGGTAGADGSTPVGVTLSQDTPGVDIAMVVGGAITGTVTSAETGTPLDQVCVSAYQTGQALDGDPAGSAGTTTDGTYHVGALDTGSYDVQFEDCGTGTYLSRWHGGSATRAGGDSVNVVLGSTTPNVDVALPLGGSISGTVREAGTGDPAVIDTVCVTVFDAAHPDSAVLGTSVENADGTYKLVGLESGDYLVEFQDCGGLYKSQWYDHAADAASATPVTVTQGADRPGIDADLVKLGQISGTVTASDTGDPIENTCISIYAASDLNSPINWSNQTCTDAQGHYTATGLPDGQFVVRFTGGGKYIGEWFNGKSSGYDADLIRVQAGDEIKSIDASLELGGTVSGTVTSAGAPVQGACAYAYDIAANQYAEFGTCTDSDGKYTIPGLPPGSYKIVISRWTGSDRQDLWWDNQASFYDATPVTVTGGHDTGGIDAAFPAVSEGLSVSGTVTLEKTAGPASNFCVDLVSASTHYDVRNACVNASSDGSYTITGVDPGDYLVRFATFSGADGVPEWYDGTDDINSAQVVSVTNASVSGIDASLREGGHVTGTVTDAGSGDPLPGVCGELTSVDFSAYYHSCTDLAGHYTTPEMAAGSYTFTMSDDSGPYLTQTYADPVDVTLGSTTAGVDFAMVKGGTFSGTLSDEATNAPLSNICVTAYNVASGDQSQQRCSDPSGHYSTAGLDAGTYKLSFTNDRGRYIAEWYDNVATENDAASLPVVIGENTPSIDARLQLGGVVAGMVTSKSTGEPVAGVCVNLYHASDGSFGGLGGCTDGDGKYESAAVPPGQYKVGFEDNSGVYVTQYFDGKKTLAEADPVTVTAGGKTSGVNAALSSSTVRGKVTDAVSGDALPGVCIYLYTADGSYSGKGTCTLADGTYVLDGIPAGGYQAAFFDPAGTHVTQWYDGASQQADAATLTAPGDLSGIDAAMTPITTVTGTVTDSLSAQPLAGVCAYLYKVGDDGASAASCTSEDGRIVFQDVVPGDYQLAYADTAGVHDTQWYSGSGDRAGSTVLHLTEGSIITGADAAMTPITTVVGQVTDAVSGDPVSGVCGYLYPVGSNNSAAAACTGPDGRVVFQGMAAGSYQVAYADTSAALATEWYGGSHLRSSADVITLTLGQAKLDADVAMDKTGSITGTVTDGSGPVANVCVYADDINGDYTLVGDCTDAAGHYTLPDLSPGEYTIGFYPPGMPTPTSIWYSNASSEAAATRVSVEAGQTTSGVDQIVP